MQVPDDPSRRVTIYLLEQIAHFVSNPPDADFQRGYLAALLDIYEEGLGGAPEVVVEDARQICADLL
jgi:hypothetical protein